MSELQNINNNFDKAYNSIVSNDILKICISTKLFQRREEIQEYFRWLNDRMDEIGENRKSYCHEIADLLIEDAQVYAQKMLSPYLVIFMEKPIELAEIIKEFVES